MTSYLFRKLFALAICVSALIVGYNYFRGTEAEQQSSKEIIAQVKGLTRSVTDLLSSEKDKYDEGKYDDALSKVKTTFAVLKEKANSLGEGGQQILDKVNELEQQEQELEKQLADLEAESGAAGHLMTSPAGGESDSNSGISDRASRAEAIRQQILKLNEDAQQVSRDFK